MASNSVTFGLDFRPRSVAFEAPWFRNGAIFRITKPHFENYDECATSSPNLIQFGATNFENYSPNNSALPPE